VLDCFIILHRLLDDNAPLTDAIRLPTVRLTAGEEPDTINCRCPQAGARIPAPAD